MIEPAYLAECLSYEPETGVITWRDRPRSHFSNQAAYTTHQRTRAGKVAGGEDRSTGYSVIGLHERLLYAHRVAWALHYGEWPEASIDHIDGDKLNNRISNLRSVGQLLNGKNSALGRNNKSGANGVCLDRRSGKWRARIHHNYREVFSRLFATKDEAIAARREAEKQFGFHPNHGRAA